MNSSALLYCYGILSTIQSLRIALDWSTSKLKTHAVYRCRSDLTLLDRCAEAQWVKRDTNIIEELMRELAQDYPDFTADWFRC